MRLANKQASKQRTTQQGLRVWLLSSYGVLLRSTLPCTYFLVSHLLLLSVVVRFLFPGAVVWKLKLG